FVIPNIGSMLTDLGGPDAQLPAITMVMLAISDFMINFWFILIPVLVGSVVAAFRYIKTDKGKKKFHQLTLRVPGVNTIIKKVAVARFARTFPALIGAGVPLPEARSVGARAAGDKRYDEILGEADDGGKRRKQLGEVISENALLPAT